MTEIAAVAAVLLFAGFVKGAVGIGLPSISMGLLALMIPPAAAAAITVGPAFLTNLQLALAGPNLWGTLRRFRLMYLATAAAVFAFAGALSASAGAATVFLGIVLAIYGAYSLATPQIAMSARVERWLTPLSGALTGTSTAFTGVSMLPAVPVLQAARLPRDAFLQAIGVSVSICATSLAVTLWLSGAFAGVSPAAPLVACAAGLAGSTIGARVRRRLDEALFRRVFLAGLIVLGGYLALK